MKIDKVWAVYFSATGTTGRIARHIAENAAAALGAEYGIYDFTLPESRTHAPRFHANELVVFGTPVIAGRVPNVLLKYLGTITGGGATAVPVAVYGNRDYDDALIELRDILEEDGFHTIAAAAFIGEHSFSNELAKGRPDDADLKTAGDFAREVAGKVSRTAPSELVPIHVKGTPKPYRGYYQPRDRQGNPINILKVKPLIQDNCTNCLLCAKVCPMGSISFDHVKEYTGICIKCGACVKKCPVQARYYDDEGFLYHRRELEEGLKRRAEPELFL